MQTLLRRSCVSAGLVALEACLFAYLGIFTPRQALAFAGTACVGLCFGLGMGVAAWTDSMLTLRQMQERYPGKEGIPNLLQGGMWADDLCLTPALAFAAVATWQEWSLLGLCFWLVTAAAVSLIRHRLDAKSIPWPTSLASIPESLGKAGMVHIPYDIAAMALAAQFYFNSKPGLQVLVGISVPIAVLMVVGTHTTLYLYHKRVRRLPWVPAELSPWPQLALSLGSLLIIATGNWLGWWKQVGAQVQHWLGT